MEIGNQFIENYTNNRVIIAGFSDKNIEYIADGKIKTMSSKDFKKKFQFYSKYHVNPEKQKILNGKFYNNCFELSDEQLDRINGLKDSATEFIYFLCHNFPESRELSLAITKLEESVFYAESSIYKNESSSNSS